MRRYSPYIVGVMVDPVRYTGLGIYLALLACVKEVFSSEDLQERSFAIQGVGKVGQELLKFLYPHTHKIYITDINKDTLSFVKQKYPDVKVVKPEEIHKQKVDVFSPCALSNCLNSKSITELNCPIVCGGANCQLESPEIAEKLYKNSILYAPDYLVNAGGLISVYDEYEYKNTRVGRVEERVKVIRKNMEKIISLSKSLKKNTSEVADTLARKIFDTIV
jgi:leucine dehydrogenase